MLLNFKICKFIVPYLVIVSVMSCTHRKSKENVPLSDQPSGKDEAVELLQIKILDDKIITKFGEEFPLIHWDSQFEKHISLKISIPARSKKIYEAFKKFKLATKDNALNESFQSWLLDYCLYLGSSHDASWAMLDSPKYPELKKTIVENVHVKELVNNFFDEILINNKNKSPNKKAKHNVTILTTSGGGGHYTAAEGIKKLLTENHYNANLLDEIVMNKEHDPLWLVTREWTLDSVYDRIFQQQNNPNLAKKYYSAAWFLRDYIPARANEVRLKYVSEHNPDFIFSTHHFISDSGVLAYMSDHPMAFVATDYAIPDAMENEIMMFDPLYLEYWVPAASLSLFDNIAKDDNFKQMWSKSKRYNLMSRFWKGEISKDEFFNSIDALKLAGYPIRSAFVKEMNPEKVDILKSEMEIHKDSKAVLITMGKAGVGTLKELVGKIVEDVQSTNEKVTFVIVCGNNHELQSEIQNLIKHNKHKSLTFKIEGLVNEQKMANYYKASDLVISKAGGATAAEVVEMNVPILIVHEQSHVWENGNVNYLLETGLGEVLDERASINSQISKMLAKNLRFKEHSPAVHWRSEILSNLKRRIHKFYE